MDNVEVIKIISAMIMFVLALILSIFLFVRIKKDSNMAITSRKWTITGKSVVNIYRFIIILGIILIAFFIIMLGMMIYNNVYGTTEDILNNTENQITNINNMEFENYFGKNVSGASVKSLIQKVQANNRKAISDDNEVGHKIYVQLDGEDIETSNEIKTSKRYWVGYVGNNTGNNKKEFGTDYWKNGYIKSIKILTIRD